MRWLVRLLITSMLSTVIALSLSVLPQLEDGWNSPVFNLARAEPISEMNIVDVLSKTQLHLRIRKVEVSRAIVSIDLFTTPSTDRLEIAKDVYAISQVMVNRSSNINQVLIRVLDGSKQAGGSASLLMASDARREQMVPKLESSFSVDDQQELETYLQKHFRVTYTRNWQEKFELIN
ncbi:hypothetical protein [Paenibacillus agricola]|uniref:Uncharacterized protein n=1 Tax=Paenibacillus agricola TaxID=2716264 RepID=A0ABX0J0U8_9BACL|nr:hypothetical protein [Paenibacillus agricola]NHN28729.1 hypothetical protein [Paenibacillus agricola]